MTQQVTLLDVAAQAGVHIATVSRALNPATRDMVRTETAERIDRAARELGYSVNVIARSLRQQRSSTVGVLIPDLTNPLFPPLVRGIEETLLASGISTLVANTDSEVDKQQHSYDALRTRRVDGFIFATALRDDAFLRRVHQQGISAVLVNRSTDERLFPAILGDDSSGMRQALDHLVRLGHRAIGHLAGPSTMSAGHDRARFFNEHVQTLGLSMPGCPTVQGNGFTVAAGHEAMARLLQSAPQITAVVAANDLMAVGAMRQLVAQGLSCPDDLSVIGYNDTMLSADVGPGLTTIAVPITEMGRVSAAALLDGDATASDVVLPVDIVVRGSTSVPRR